MVCRSIWVNNEYVLKIPESEVFDRRRNRGQKDRFIRIASDTHRIDRAEFAVCNRWRGFDFGRRGDIGFQPRLGLSKQFSFLRERPCWSSRILRFRYAREVRARGGGSLAALARRRGRGRIELPRGSPLPAVPLRAPVGMVQAGGRRRVD